MTPDEFWTETFRVKNQPVPAATGNVALMPMTGGGSRLSKEKPQRVSDKVGWAGFASLGYEDEEARVRATTYLLDAIADEDPLEAAEWVVHETMLHTILCFGAKSERTRGDAARVMERSGRFKADIAAASGAQDPSSGS